MNALCQPPPPVLKDASLPGPPRLHASGLRFTYANGDFSLFLPELILQPGQVLRLSGPSGAGKSTLLRLLCGLLTPSHGTLIANTTFPLHRLPPKALRNWRLQHAGLVFQDFALLDYLTAAENILLPARFQNLPGSEWKRLSSTLPSLAERLEVAHLLNRPTAHLSQGERQRVALLRALITSPTLLFADEPTASLDRKRRDLVLDLIDDHLRQSGASLILVTHDPEVAARFPLELNVEDLQSP